MKKYKVQWYCILICDVWIDGKGSFITNFLIDSSSGIVFLKYIVIINVIKDVEQTFERIRSGGRRNWEE